MNSHSSFPLILLCSAAVGLLVLFQVHWIRTDYDLREEQFGNRVNMALCAAVNAWSQDSASCSAVKTCVSTTPALSCSSPSACTQEPQRSQLDTLLRKSLAYYQLPLAYEFGIVPQLPSQKVSPEDQKVLKDFSCTLEPLTQNSQWELSLQFPEKPEYLLGQMKMMLISALVVILLIGTGFILSLRAYFHQKKLRTQNIDTFNYLAHNFKTPLTNISLASNRLAKHAQAEQQTGWLAIIQAENQKLIRQVERILEVPSLAQLQPGRQWKSVEIHNLLGEAVATMIPQLQERSGQVIQEYQATHTTLKGDPEHLTRLFINLLDNANKYAPQAPRLKVRTFDRDEGIQIHMVDNGMGMRKGECEKVFHKYYRTDRAQELPIKGSGLGMGYVKEIVEAHQGTIQIVSEPEVGTCIRIWFPARLTVSVQPQIPH